MTWYPGCREQVNRRYLTESMRSLLLERPSIIGFRTNKFLQGFPKVLCPIWNWNLEFWLVTNTLFFNLFCYSVRFTTSKRDEKFKEWCQSRYLFSLYPLTKHLEAWVEWIIQRWKALGYHNGKVVQLPLFYRNWGSTPKRGRFRWLGYEVSMEEDRLPKRLPQGHLSGNHRRGSLRLHCLDNRYQTLENESQRQRCLVEACARGPDPLRLLRHRSVELINWL